MMESTVREAEASAVCPEPQPLKAGDHVYLVDGSTYIFRAYFAMFKAAQARGRSFTRSDGTPVGAVMTFCNMLWKLLREGLGEGKPSHVAVVFDHSAASFRNEIYDQYKANRDEPPDELVPQFPLIRDAVRAFGLKPIEQKGYEADDLIATYARQAVAAGAEVTIVSGDKDLMQVVGSGIIMYDPMPGNERQIGRDEVIAKFGVPPEKVVDVQALCGDATDNVPGVPGIGVKTAAQLIQEFGDLDTLLANAASIKQQMRRERLLQYADQARLSRELVRLKDDLEVETPLAETCLAKIDPAPLLAFMRVMEFTTLTKRVATAFGVDSPEMPAPQRPQEERAAAGPAHEEGEPAAKQSMPAAMAAQEKARIRQIPVDYSKYKTITNLEQLKTLIAEARELGHVCLDTETTSLDALKAELVGFAVSVTPGTGFYVPLAHRMGDLLDLGGTALTEQIPFAEGMALLKELLEDEGVLKIGQNTKYDIMVLRRYGIEMAPVDDTLLLSYVLDAGIGVHGMDELSQRHLGHKPITFKDVAGSGRQQVTFERVPIDRATHYAGEDADITLRTLAYPQAPPCRGRHDRRL